MGLGCRIQGLGHYDENFVEALNPPPLPKQNNKQFDAARNDLEDEAHENKYLALTPNPKPLRQVWSPVRQLCGSFIGRLCNREI